MKLKPNLTKVQLKNALNIAKKEVKEWSDFLIEVRVAIEKNKKI